MRGRAHDHKVILAPPIAEELRRWRDAHAERSAYVFPGTQGRQHLSREAVEKALRQTLGLEGKHSPHGWRSSFSTLAKDQGFTVDAASPQPSRYDKTHEKFVDKYPRRPAAMEGKR